MPYTFMPFGLGPRNCVGQRLAHLEMKTALIHLIHNYTLRRCAKTEVPLQLNKGSQLIGIKNGLYVDFEKIEH